MDSAGQTVALALLVPAVGALLIACAGRLPNLRETITGITALALFACVLTLLPTVVGGGRPELPMFTVMPGLQLAFKVEPLGMLFALIASGLWIVNSLYSIGYMRGNAEAHQTRFYVCFALALAATMGIAFAANLFTLFVFYELLTLVTYPLVTHHGTPEARQGGRTYLGILLGTSIVFLLPALVCIWYVAGTTDFVPGGILQGKPGDLRGIQNAPFKHVAKLTGGRVIAVGTFAGLHLVQDHRRILAGILNDIAQRLFERSSENTDASRLILIGTL